MTALDLRNSISSSAIAALSKSRKDERKISMQGAEFQDEVQNHGWILS